MKNPLIILAGVALGTAIAGTALGESHGGAAADVKPAVEAREATMELFAWNMRTLGGMAKGAIPYDAEKASAAAKDMALLMQLDMSGYWPEGSSTAELGDETEALPAIWEDMDGFHEKGKALGMAVQELQGAAGEGLDPLKAAVGKVGASCGGCHKQFRKSD